MNPCSSRHPEQDQAEKLAKGQRNKIVDEEIKKDIISSSVTLIATLDDIKLKIKQIMELKSGDLIPISDPTVVFLTHNNKKIFKGTAGQANTKRVVKIEENI